MKSLRFRRVRGGGAMVTGAGGRLRSLPRGLWNDDLQDCLANGGLVILP